MAVWPQTECKNILVEFKFDGGASQHTIINIVHVVYQGLGMLPSSRLRYLNKAVSLQTCKKYNWQCASAELAICTAHIEGCWVGPNCMYYIIMHWGVKITLPDFIFGGLNPNH